MGDSLSVLDAEFRRYLQQVLDLASRQAAQAEVFAVESLHTPVTFEANRLKVIETKETRGVALRVMADGRVGLASTSRLDDPTRLVGEALAVARLGAEAGYELPGDASLPALKLFHRDAAEWGPQAMVEAGQGMIQDLLEANPELLCEAHLGKTIQTVAIPSSNRPNWSATCRLPINR